MREIASYINSRSISEMALLVNGKWGYGKTFHVRKIVDEELKNGYFKKIYYVSLNGISSVASIDDQLIAQKLKIDGKGGKIAASIAKTAVRVLMRNSEKTELKEGDFGALTWNDVVSFNDCVFIFDDLERCPLDKDRVLGYIHRNFLLDSDNRVIYICDENKFSPEEKERYKSVKEKYIGWTVAFKPNFVEAGRAIFNSFPTLQDAVNIDDVLSWCTELKCFNLRTLRFFFSTISVIKHLQPGDLYARSIFQFSVLVVCKYYKEGLIESGMQVIDLPPYLNPNNKKEISRDMLENPDIRALEPIRLLYDNPNILYDGIPLTYTVSDQLLNLVTSLSYDPEKLKSHILKLEGRYAIRYMSQTVRNAKKLYSYDHLTTDKFIEIREGLLAGIRGNTLDAIDLLSAMKAIRFLCQQEEEFTGLSMHHWAEIENQVLSEGYQVNLPDGDQRAGEYDFSGGISALVPDTKHPLYCKFYDFFCQHQDIVDDLDPTLPDLTADPILNPIVPGAWKDRIIDYLKHVRIQHFHLLIEEHRGNHNFWLTINDFLYGLSVEDEDDDVKNLINEFISQVAGYATDELKCVQLSEARLFQNLADCRDKVAFT